MYQIAIGDDLSFGGYTVLHGHSVSAPFKRAEYLPRFQQGDIIKDQLTLWLSGTASQLSAAITTLEKIAFRITLQKAGAYSSRQFIRFRITSTAGYSYVILDSLKLDINPDSHRTRQTGTLVITLVFTRPNFYEGAKYYLPLTGKNGTDATIPQTIYNHYDSDATHGNYVAIDPDDVEAELPSPLRILLQNTTASNRLQNVFISLFQHPTNNAPGFFSYTPTAFSSGSLTANAGAITGYYRSVSWSATTWQDLGKWLLAASNISVFMGGAFRPILRFYSALAYTDLYMKIVMKIGTHTIAEYDPIYIDNNYGYAIFPTITFPPAPISWFYDPQAVYMHLYGQHDTSASYTITFDCLTLLPVQTASFLTAFYTLGNNETLVDDAFYDITSANLSTSAEIVTHIRTGPPLLVSPHDKSLIQVLMADDNDDLDPMRTAKIQAFYYPRNRVL